MSFKGWPRNVHVVEFPLRGDFIGWHVVAAIRKSLHWCRFVTSIIKVHVLTDRWPLHHLNCNFHLVFVIHIFKCIPYVTFCLHEYSKEISHEWWNQCAVISATWHRLPIVILILYRLTFANRYRVTPIWSTVWMWAAGRWSHLSWLITQVTAKFTNRAIMFFRIRASSLETIFWLRKISTFAS